VGVTLYEMHNYIADKAGLKIYQTFTALLTRVQRQSGKWATVWQRNVPTCFPSRAAPLRLNLVLGDYDVDNDDDDDDSDGDGDAGETRCNTSEVLLSCGAED